jgi:ABC-type multidrug transport system fused ATPase/permease subunit
MTNTIAQVSVALDRVLAVSQADTVIPEHPAAVAPRPFRGEITFEHVGFGYDPAVPVLRDVSFTIKPGGMVGIVGPTGSGKSTIVSTLRNADKIMVVKNGLVTEQGTHEQLLNRDGAYARLHHLQFTNRHVLPRQAG